MYKLLEFTSEFNEPSKLYLYISNKEKLKKTLYMERNGLEDSILRLLLLYPN